MDYGVQFNRLMYTRLIKGGNITLFSPSDVPGLYDAFLLIRMNLNVYTPRMRLMSLSVSAPLKQ